MAGFSFGTPTTSAPSFSLGSNASTTGGVSGFNFVATPSLTTSGTFQSNVPTTSSGAINFGGTSVSSGTGFTFGSTGGLSMGTPATTQATLSFKPGGLTFGTPATSTQSTIGVGFGTQATTQQPTLGFGTQSTSQQPALSFGTPTSTQQPTLSFGTPVSTQQPTLSFGTSASAQQPTLSFGTPASTQQPTLSFGTPASTQQPTLNFSTPASTQQSTLGFGTPATSGITFGSTPTTTQQTQSFGTSSATTQPISFGSSLGTTQPSLGFGTNTATTQPGLTFGSTPAVSQPSLNFGLSTPATTASPGFSLGTPASTATGLSFGLGSQAATAKPTVTFGTAATTAAATTASNLLNFSVSKTTATPGFSLSVSAGTGSGSLFALPTTTAPTTSAPVAFKGLGGVDTSSTQGTGQKDAKSVKENIVNQEIMQTLDTFKNFVKQQKNLSCEVSRAPVKPMHKVTEDTDALKQLLTVVSSALQKNKVIANKLKTDTVKCLSLCEMAQRTHDTPPGLQNDNVAPLKFFIQLVSKFERDIQVLRQEIDNTEKHVNSLSYPAILTPQELSVALRRLHDSFVALAGRLQTAHAGVIAQKERHLSLRRHFLKDHTNIFESSSRTVTATTVNKPQCMNILPMTGPTPFSSMGAVPNVGLMTGQDKPTTFSAGYNPLSAWGSSTISNMSSTPVSNFLQTPGTSILNTPQPVDNQNFQLGKPPPGNKRGKR